MAARAFWYPDRRDMIWADRNPQAGKEMKDMHLLMVLSPLEFNERTGIVKRVRTATFSDTSRETTQLVTLFNIIYIMRTSAAAR